MGWGTQWPLRGMWFGGRQFILESMQGAKFTAVRPTESVVVVRFQEPGFSMQEDTLLRVT